LLANVNSFKLSFVKFAGRKFGKPARQGEILNE
jgi:hypothetical protein